MKSNVGLISNFNNNSSLNRDEIQSRETALFMQNQRTTDCWCSDALSSTVVNIIERHEQINERLQSTSIADILAGIKFDSKRNHNTSLYGVNEENGGLSDIDLDLIETPLPHPHLKASSNKITNALYEVNKSPGNVWKDNDVYYNNSFDPRITFKGLHLQNTYKAQNNGDTDRLIGYPDTFNSFLDIVNPSGFANSYLHTYRQFLRDLRNQSHQMAEDDLFKIPSFKKGEAKFFDKFESGLHTNEEKVHDAPSFVGNECENIDLWSQITATESIWAEDDQRRQSPNLNDDCSTKSILVALFSKSTEDLQSSSSKQASNGLCVRERSDTGSGHVQAEVLEQQAGSNESQATKSVQSRILPYLLTVNYDHADSKEPPVLPNELNRGDAGTDRYIVDDIKLTPQDETEESFEGEDFKTNNNELEETFWAPCEAGDFILNNESQGNTFVPPFNPWSTVHVEYLDRPIVAAQTSMFWSHQQRCQQKQQQQEQQQKQQNSQIQHNQNLHDQTVQKNQEEQQNQQETLEKPPQSPGNKQHGQRKEQYRSQEVFYSHNQPDIPSQKQHQQQLQMSQNQYQEQHKHFQQTQYNQQQYVQQTQQHSIQQQNTQFHPQHLHDQQKQNQQQWTHNLQFQQQRLQNNFQQTHQNNPRSVHPVHQAPTLQQQNLPQLQIHFNPNHVLFQQPCGNIQGNQGNNIKQENAGQKQLCGMQLNYGQATVLDGYTYTNESQQSQNLPQYGPNSTRPIYQTGPYYSQYPQYSTIPNYQSHTSNSAYQQSSGAVRNEQVLNLNFIQSRPQHSNVQFDDEVWYINGIPHQHAKPMQPNENVELAQNQHFWPQIYGHPTVPPPSNACTQQSYHGTYMIDSAANVRSNNQQKFYNQNQAQNLKPNNSNTNNNNAGVDEYFRDYCKEDYTSTELVAIFETRSSASALSCKSEHSLLKLSDDRIETSRESCASETPESLSELSDSDGDEESNDIEAAFHNLCVGETNNDFVDDNVNGTLDTRKWKKTQEFIGRQIRVVSNRSKANREWQYQRKTRNRTSHLIKII